MKTKGNEPKIKHPRIIKKICAKCGHHQMWGSRSEIGFAQYRFKCSKCGYVIK